MKDLVNEENLPNNPITGLKNYSLIILTSVILISLIILLKLILLRKRKIK